MTDDNAFSADDLELLTSLDGDDAPAVDDGNEGGNENIASPKSAAAKDPSPDTPKGEKTAASDKPQGQPAGKDTLASGAETPPPKQPQGYWPEGWREKMAEFAAAGDSKEQERLLRQLNRYVDPAAIFAKTRELETKFSAGGLVKVPGKDASPEELAAFHKALGVPEEPADYLKDLQLENGMVVGEADKPLLQDMLGIAHKTGATQPVVDGIVKWYYDTQEKLAADLDQADDAYRREAETALKDEFGPSYTRYRNAIGPLFATAPGGADVENENSLYARLLGGRTADGRMIGNDPDMIRFLIGLAQEINPAATVTEDGDQSGKSLETELAEIAKLRTENPKKYWSDPVQARELELINAQQRLQAKA